MFTINENHCVHRQETSQVYIKPAASFYGTNCIEYYSELCDNLIIYQL